MKRLIDGVTYNTDTATLIAKSEYEGDWNNEDCQILGKLYQTRSGVFFIVEDITIKGVYNHQEGEWTPEKNKIRFVKCSDKDAKDWINSDATGTLEIFLNPFEDKVDEDETEGTIYVRMPASLKRKIEAAAKTDDLSANAWAMRCFEKCLGSKGA